MQLSDSDFRAGSLRVTSYARPAKLFTAHHKLIATGIGVLDEASLKRITDVVVHLIQSKS